MLHHTKIPRLLVLPSGFHVRTKTLFYSSWHAQRRFSNTAPRRQDHYAVLGVEQTATSEEIKAAYYERVKLYHPDHNPHAPRSRYDALQLAYFNLKDEEKRKAYDQSLLPRPATRHLKTTPSSLEETVRESSAPSQPDVTPIRRSRLESRLFNRTHVKPIPRRPDIPRRPTAAPASDSSEEKPSPSRPRRVHRRTDHKPNAGDASTPAPQPAAAKDEKKSSRPTPSMDKMSLDLIRVLMASPRGRVYVRPDSPVYKDPPPFAKDDSPVKRGLLYDGLGAAKKRLQEFDELGARYRVLKQREEEAKKRAAEREELVQKLRQGIAAILSACVLIVGLVVLRQVLKRWPKVAGTTDESPAEAESELDSRDEAQETV